MVVSGDYLFIADMNEDYSYSVFVYDKTSLRLIHESRLNHSITGLYAYGNGVVALGRQSSPHWSSHLTTVTSQNGRFSKSHRLLSDEIIAESAVADGAKLYLNEKGSRAIFSLANSRSYLRKMNHEFLGPANDMRIENNTLYVVELRGLFQYGDEALAAVDLKTGEKRFIADGTKFMGLHQVEIIGDTLYGVELAVDRVVAIDLAKDAVIGRITLPQGAYGIGRYGQCAAVVSGEAKILSFIRAHESGIKEIHSVDLAHAGDKLKQPRSLGFDMDSHRVFVRSNYPCGGCTVTQSSVVAFDLSEIAALEGCFQN